jgi:hypothetical protein
MLTPDVQQFMFSVIKRYPFNKKIFKKNSDHNFSYLLVNFPLSIKPSIKCGHGVDGKIDYLSYLKTFTMGVARRTRTAGSGILVLLILAVIIPLVVFANQN